MWVFFILVIIFIAIINSTAKIEINEKIIYTYKKIKNLEYKICIKLFKRIKLFTFKIRADKFIGKNNKIIKGGYRDLIKILKYIFKNDKIKKEKIYLNLKIGTEDAALTSYIVATLYTIISLFIAKQIDKISRNNYRYEIIPLYINKNELKLSINCIVSIKLVHIINVIYVLKRKDDEKNGRTSNRRAYDNSNEQHKRYGRCKHNYR